MVSSSARLCLVVASAVAAAHLIATAPAEAQILDRIKEKVSEAKSALDGAKDVRCEVQGVCGEIWQSDLFAPQLYNSLAVTVFDVSNRYRGENLNGMLLSSFEGQLLENGFLLAASSDAEAVRERIGRSDAAWSDEALAQLKDFVDGVDAVLVLQVDAVGLGQCDIDGKPGTEATVHLSARFLNVDAGDIPWIGKHKATGCADGGAPALTAALEKVTSQLAGALPKID